MEYGKESRDEKGKMRRDGKINDEAIDKIKLLFFFFFWP